MHKIEKLIRVIPWHVTYIQAKLFLIIERSINIDVHCSTQQWMLWSNQGSHNYLEPVVISVDAIMFVFWTKTRNVAPQPYNQRKCALTNFYLFPDGTGLLPRQVEMWSLKSGEKKQFFAKIRKTLPHVLISCSHQNKHKPTTNS